jgi:cell wall-associated NlpC family hydrolase
VPARAFPGGDVDARKAAPLGAETSAVNAMFRFPAAALALALVTGCAASGASAPQAGAVARLSESPRQAGTPAPASFAAGSAGANARVEIVRAAREMLDRPYRRGGADARGFDCSGLVIYAYGRAGRRGLPRTAQHLFAQSQRIPLEALAPGDLLFFTFGSRTVSHVAIFVGDRTFVHAPKRGARVERVSFDHPYWRSQIRLAGRLLR